MLLIPNAVFLRYIAHLQSRGIDAARYAEYKKWLRFYLDFCDKYPMPEDLAERVRLFMDKLRAKKQSEAQLKCAAHAVSLYFEMQRSERKSPSKGVAEGKAVAGAYPAQAGSPQIKPTKQAEGKTGYAVAKPAVSAVPPAAKQSAMPPGRFAVNRSHFSEDGYVVTTNSPEWDAVLATLAAMAGEIKLRHYSRKTLQT